MDLLTTPAAMRTWAADRRRRARTIGCVPTMGALHRGHLELVAAAAARSDDVCVSIFVNPLQFNEHQDFDAYPRPIDDDLARCADAGVAAVYAPTGSAMYPDTFQTRVVPGPLATTMEGAMRPGHFEGVATVVTKLFGAITPDVATFGEKDYQQLRVIEQLVADLDLGVEIVRCPIVREPDGLAMSSRNLRLRADQRRAARCVPRALEQAVATAARGADVAELVRAAIDVIDAADEARHEYTTVFDARSLVALDHLHDDGRRPGRVRVATAVWFGDVRLIDNRDLFES